MWISNSKLDIGLIKMLTRREVLLQSKGPTILLQIRNSRLILTRENYTKKMEFSASARDKMMSTKCVGGEKDSFEESFET